MKNWTIAAQQYLARLGQAEYRSGLKQHVKAGRKAKTFRLTPSSYFADLVKLLGEDNEEEFKYRKALNGQDSPLGV